MNKKRKIRLLIIITIITVAIASMRLVLLPSYASELKVPLNQIEVEPSVSEEHFVGTIAITSPVTLGTFDISMQLNFEEDEISGYVEVTRTLLFSDIPTLSGTIIRLSETTTPTITIHSEPFTGQIGNTEVQRQFTLEGEMLDEGNKLQGTYMETITGLLPEPLLVEGIFFLTKPAEVTNSSSIIIQVSSPRVSVGESAIMTATLLGDLQQPLNSIGVTFDSSLGSITNAMTQTNESGIATAVFHADDTPGIALITISSDTGETTETQIEVFAEPTIELSANNTVVSTDDGSTVVDSVLRDEKGDPLTGLDVTFQTDFGTVSLSVVTTNEQGKASTVFRAGSVPGEAEVKARVLDSSASITIQVESPRVSTLILHSQLTQVETGGTTVITAQVQDQFGNGMPGQVISFSGVLGTVSPGSAVSDEEGKVIVNFVAGNVTGEATITALAFTKSESLQIEIY